MKRLQVQSSKLTGSMATYRKMTEGPSSLMLKRGSLPSEDVGKELRRLIHEEATNVRLQIVADKKTSVESKASSPKPVCTEPVSHGESPLKDLFEQSIVKTPSPCQTHSDEHVTPGPPLSPGNSDKLTEVDVHDMTTHTPDLANLRNFAKQIMNQGLGPNHMNIRLFFNKDASCTLDLSLDPKPLDVTGIRRQFLTPKRESTLPKWRTAPWRHNNCWLQSVPKRQDNSELRIDCLTYFILSRKATIRCCVRALMKELFETGTLAGPLL